MRTAAVTFDPAICSGEPCVAGSRVPVYMIVDAVWEAVSVEVARIVADHWRVAAMEGGDSLVPWRLAAHPLCCVLAALDGETDPRQLGIEEGSEAEAAILALTSEKGFS